ncbi:S-methyl-5-thioribose-1-phosphate isomerase [Anaeromyxobacter oryzisoli]|jgi:methylthioribose-1-phosphate isomerase|uniref:S-methyl-5-thioribose-1-phosphate isomerase n=1 Tax=Anaeromyxobacter oryzisoli TaxID=2925408 RepID=UPI001F59FD2C|nr:S-methyl-5-thioribose-1-phosphate isomerase [Anaeromyxobacter sp. SG63]
MNREPLRPVLYDDARDVVRLLDQKRLPAEEAWLELETADQVAAAIKDLTVRGAPAIGVAAAYGLAVEARRGAGEARLRAASETLIHARPTAVNLAWAVRRMGRLLGRGAAALLAEAHAIRDEDEAACRRIGALGAPLVPPRARVLTHCNAGALATAGYGTALGVVRAAVEAGNPISVFADETRPFLQGARLTAWELHRDGIPVTILTDGMAGWLMQRGEIGCVVVGADRIAANGDVANKIGTYALAVLAAHHGLPFYVAAPWSTVDLHTPTGAAIPIEERGGDEVVMLAGQRIAPAGVPARYPAFDVTPAALVTAVITDRGVVRAPFDAGLRALA